MNRVEQKPSDGIRPEQEEGTHRVSSSAMQSLFVLAIALCALVPAVGDFGLTWDEPAYRYSQVMSAQWWEQWALVHSWRDVLELMDPRALLYYWPYGRYGINFHPPLAGQLNLATHAVFSHWMNDIAARRIATMIEFALCATIGFHFLAKRYGTWVGAVMAGSLVLMPRLYGQAHLIDTDIAGLLLWAVTALAFWNGLHEPHGRKWRVLVGILLGLAFVEKMAAVMVLVPLLLWLLAGYLPRTLRQHGGRADWIDGVLTTGAMLIPLGLAFQQIQLLQQRLPPPGVTNLFVHRPSSDWPGVILGIPLVIWCVRRLLGWMFPKHKLWGAERPALEIWTSILAFAPVIGWLGNPAWWRETLPRLAHYYTLSFDREGALPRIQIIYFGQVYEFSLPWHNAWVLLGITVPAAILVAAAIGLIWGIMRIRRDRLPFYFLVHLLTLPVIRMFPTPAHDGVRLFLPTFFFLAAFAGWGTIWLADALARGLHRRAWLFRLGLSGAVLGSAAFALIRVHPYELSYYNELIGGPRGAWEKGFELSYWYDAFNGPLIAEINRRLPPRAEVDFLNDMTKTAVPVFADQQSLGILRADIQLGRSSHSKFPYAWLLTQDSKAAAFTRLLFAMRPWLASEPRQLDGAQVAAVADPVAVSRAWALQLLLDAPDLRPPDPPAAPFWVRTHAPWLARFWGDGLVKPHRLTVNQAVLNWSRTDPDGLLAAARKIAANESIENDAKAQRLMVLLVGEPNSKVPSVRRDLLDQLLEARPRALVEAVEIINNRRDDVVTVMTRYGYTDHRSIGGYLDRDLGGTSAEKQVDSAERTAHSDVPGVATTFGSAD
ncbi:MAG TPA: glycosyltransferase family 39 protein [Isosphaeraceae bacterium]|nr:glycosyltransferase family 39 protein [Isosphaeraceae bacterium]